MSDRWLYAWGTASIALGCASLIVPLYVVSLGGDPFVLGLLAAVAAFVGVPGALLFGRLADRTGKRRVFVLLALALIAAMLAVMPLLESILFVIAANAVIWFAFAAAVPVLTLLAVVDVPEAAWSERIALLNKYQGVGWAAGLALGAVWTAGAELVVDPITAQRGLFAICAGAAAIALAVGIRSLPADPAPGEDPRPRRLRRAIRTAARFNVRGVTFPFSPAQMDVRGLHPGQLADRFSPQLALYFVAVCFVFAGSAAFFAPLPAFLSDVGFGTDGIFLLYVVSSVAAAVFFDRAGRLAADHDVTLVQFGGLLGRAIAFPIAAVVGIALGASTIGIAVAALIFVLIGLTWAVIAVTAGTLVTRLAPARVRGEALGVYSAASALAGGVGSLVGGWLAAWGYLLAFGVAGGLVAVGAGIVLVVRRHPRPIATSEQVPSS